MDYNKEGREDAFHSFAQALQQLSGVVRQLTEAETAKAEAAAAREHKRMDSFLKEEQALILKVRGLEQQRDRHAAVLGWKGLTFRQVLKAANEEEAAVLSPIFSAMEENLAQLTDAKETAGRIITTRLREFELLLGTGSVDGAPGAEAPSYFHNKYV